MDAIRKQASKLREQVAKQQQVMIRTLLSSLMEPFFLVWGACQLGSAFCSSTYHLG